MATRPTLYIGLGGTGIQAIAHTKKMFEDEFGRGNIPPVIQFLAIDFDMSAPDRPDLHDDFVWLDKHVDYRALYEVGRMRNVYPWLFEDSGLFIPPFVRYGAGQRRTTGRFLFEANVEMYEQVIHQKLALIHSIGFPASSIDVHVVTSLAGGTGAGIFLNLAQMIRDIGGGVNIIGYGVLHGIFRTMDPTCLKTPRVVANAYASILDLDYLMTATPRNPIEVSFNGKKREINRPIYDNFFVIDNEQDDRTRIIHISDICRKIGLHLFADNFSPKGSIYNLDWRYGSYDVDSKRGWVQRFGAFQIVYRGDMLADVYSQKATVCLVNDLIHKNDGLDFLSAVRMWASENRLTYEDEQLLDCIYNFRDEPVVVPAIDINDSVTDIRQALERYSDSCQGYHDDAIVENLKRDLSGALNDKAYAFLCDRGGIGNVLVFLEELDCYVRHALHDMIDQCEYFRKRIADDIDCMRDGLREFEDYNSRFIKLRSRCTEILEEDVIAPAVKARRDKLEVRRRETACYIYSLLLREIQSLNSIIREFEYDISNLRDACHRSLAEALVIHVPAEIEYDLSRSDLMSMSFEPDDCFFSDFLETLDKSLLKEPCEVKLGDCIERFCKGLPGAQAYREKLIMDVIDELPEDEYEKLKKMILRGTGSMLRLEDKGLLLSCTGNCCPTSKLCSVYTFTTDRPGRFNRLMNDSNLFQRSTPMEWVYHIRSLRQKLIITRTDVAVIPYCISSFPDCLVEHEYTRQIEEAQRPDSRLFNPHIDKQLFEQMQAIDFKLSPERAANNIGAE